jgi:O-6-methylguanine DNA methyltransferase
MDREIVIRPAVSADAATIAEVIAMAIGDEAGLRNYCGEEYMAVLTEVARREATQYSWQNALVAELNGVVAGAVVGYDGAQLYTLREGTFATINEFVERTQTIVDETSAGEYYLDSVGVLPQYRGMGVGRALVSAFCDKAFAEGHQRVGLIVDFENPDAERLYTSLGFRRIGTRPFFTHQMWHLQRCATTVPTLHNTAEHATDTDIRKRVEQSSDITPFQRRVYLELLSVPCGQTITYGELARRIGCRSAQAVGQALKRNPFAPEVPCHRVVASDGSLGGYLGQRSGKQVERKRELLEIERQQNKE